MNRTIRSVFHGTVVAVITTILMPGVGTADPIRPYVAFGAGKSFALSTPGQVTRFRLNGQPLAGPSRQSIGAAPFLDFEAGVHLPVRGDSARLGLAATFRDGYAITSANQFAVGRAIRGGTGLFTADGAAVTGTEVSSTAVMAVIRYDARRIGERFGLHPWIGAGAGWARNRVDAFEISYRADLALVAPGEIASGSISDATQSVAQRSSDGFAWQISAGVAHELSPGWLVSLGYRYASLGSYRLAGNGDGPASISIDEQRLDIGFGGQSDNLDVQEITLMLRHEF